jgi:hypothetical protein
MCLIDDRGRRHELPVLFVGLTEELLGATVGRILARQQREKTARIDEDSPHPSRSSR